MIPKTDKKIGLVVRKFLKMKADISAANKKIEDMKSKAYDVEIELIKNLEVMKLEKFSVSNGSVSLKKSFSGNVKDKQKLFDYAVKSNNMQLLGISLNQAAYREMIEDGKASKLRFIDKYNSKKLSVGRKKVIK